MTRLKNKILDYARRLLTPKVNIDAGYLSLSHKEQERSDAYAALHERTLAKALLAGALTLACVPTADAAAIYSHAGLANSMSAATVAISTHYAWQSNNPWGTDAVWIAPFDAGPGGSVFIPDTGTTPTYTVYDSFTSDAGFLSLSVWADNTAGVFMDSVLLFAPVFTYGAACTGQPIGCRPQDAGVFSIPLTAGLHTLQFDVYQAFGTNENVNNPTGLLYAGEAPDPVHTPEPAGCALIGMALIGVGVYARRRHV